MVTATVVLAAGGQTQTVQVDVRSQSAGTLVVGSSPGDVGIPGVDAALGHKAPRLRIFNNNPPPATWLANDQQPADNRPVLVSVTGDPGDYAAGKYDAATRQWLAGAPAGTWAAVIHEGDAKVRKGQFTQAQWIACQEHILPVIASCGVTPVAILTYQAVTDGSAASYISSAMRKVPGLILGIDTYQPGTPSATVAKMVKGMDTVAAACGLRWCIPEFGIGTANGTDADRAADVAASLTFCATHGCQGVMYWPAGAFVPGPATWAALAASYPKS